MEPIQHAVVDPVRQGGRIAIFRALAGLGDFLCVVPTLRAIRRARPDVGISYVGLAETRPLVGRFAAYVDEFIEFPGFPGLPERRPDVRRIPAFLTDVQERAFDLAIQLHGSGEQTNAIVTLFGARRMAGHYRKGSSPSDAARFLPWVDRCSEVRRGLRLTAHLGWPSDDETLEFPIAPGADDALDAIDGLGPGTPAPLVVVHPGATERARRWSPAGFAAVANELAADGCRVVVTGTAAERELTAGVARLVRQPVLDLAGRTSLDELAALLRHASLVVCNDTGVSHLAAALEVPSVVVFRASDVDRWAPLDRRRHRPVSGSVREVLSEARRALRGGQRDAA